MRKKKANRTLNMSAYMHNDEYRGKNKLNNKLLNLLVHTAVVNTWTFCYLNINYRY